MKQAEVEEGAEVESSIREQQEQQKQQHQQRQFANNRKQQHPHTLRQRRRSINKRTTRTQLETAKSRNRSEIRRKHSDDSDDNCTSESDDLTNSTTDSISSNGSSDDMQDALKLRKRLHDPACVTNHINFFFYLSLMLETNM